LDSDPVYISGRKFKAWTSVFRKLGSLIETVMFSTPKDGCYLMLSYIEKVPTKNLDWPLDTEEKQ